MKKLHALFCESTSLKCSYSTFCLYRPFYVVPKTEADRNTCLCKLHSNVEMMASALKNNGVVEDGDPNNILSLMVCNKNNHLCMKRSCDDCKSKAAIPALDCAIQNDTVKWNQWVNEVEERVKGDKPYTVKVVKKSPIEGTVIELVEDFEKTMKQFAGHVFNMKTQFRAYKACKENLDANSALIHVDLIQ